MDTVVIVGASHAAAQLCASLRQGDREGGWKGAITLVSDEAHLPYHRPPLSKSFLSGDKAIGDILIRPADAYDTMNVELRLGTRADAIDRHAREVLLSTGERLGYSKLVLCTGARVRRLPVPGADHPDVLYLRDQADALAIQSRIRHGARAVVVGGGYIGLECAASLRSHGMEVTVLEAMDRILQRVTAPAMSDLYRRVHVEEGTRIVEGAVASEIVKEDGALTVVTRNGGRHPADVVIVGIGVIPNSELASDAGLAVETDAPGGIRVDAHGRTSDPDIYAAGDVAYHHSPIYDRHMRVESVPNATEMAKTVAAHIIHDHRGRGGDAPVFGALPWFWSDQYDLKLQIAGLSEGATHTVLRGDANSREAALFSFNGPKLIAVDAVNSPRAFAFGRMAIAKGMTLDPAKVADVDVGLKACVVG